MNRFALDTELEGLLAKLFPAERNGLCPEGTALLRVFAKTRPTDLSFLQAEDLIDRTNSAFTGIDEWDVFAEHYAGCERCHA